ncbi:MAG TPA: hypothetical protein VIJ46_01875 [Rhabdochlamydiaceae bacterium]
MHKTFITLSGLVWLVVGIFLLMKGLSLITTGYVDGDQTALLLISLGLAIGFVKGRFVLRKTVKRVVDRINSLPLPIQVSQVYSKGYYFLIGGMILLGMSMRWLPIPVAVRGTVDVAIGFALMNGAILYFRAARAPVKS